MSEQQHPTSIRAARQDDAPGIGRVHARSRHATYRGIMSEAALAHITEAERTDWWTRALTSYDDRWLTLVVEADEEIVGFACTGPTGFGEAEPVAPYDLYFLYLAPGWERRGLGRELVGQTFAWLRARQVAAVQLLCLADTGTHRFYEALGGRLVEEGQHDDGEGTMLRHRVYVYDLSRDG